MSLKEPSLHHAYTLCGTQLQFIAEDTIVYRCGNALVFFNLRSKIQTMLAMEEGYSLDAYTVNFAQRLIVCAVRFG